MPDATQKTAFVFAGGGSLGAVQVGMLRELTRRGVSAAFVVGSVRGNSEFRMFNELWATL
jgi:NTE family protein